MLTDEATLLNELSFQLFLYPLEYTGRLSSEFVSWPNGPMSGSLTEIVPRLPGQKADICACAYRKYLTSYVVFQLKW